MAKAPRTIPKDVVTAQARASDPTASAFVSANAGSGKTHVLVQRVIRLLLAGVPPEKILCITFTKAAAANMAERVFATLGQWVTLDDDALDDAMRATSIPRPGPELRRKARKLFACALETPGGLKVQTIHALCTRLLQQFPFEANVPARFAVIDERDQTEMMERANLKVLLDAARDPESATGHALLTAMANAADFTFREVVREACLSRDHFLAWTNKAGSVEGAVAQLASALGIDARDRLDEIDQQILDGPFLPRSRWEEIAFALEEGSKSDQGQAERLRAAKILSGGEQVDAYLRVFLTNEKTPRDVVLTQKLSKHNPSVAGLFEAETQRIAVLIERRRAVILRDRTTALLHIATAVAANYRREKQERGLFDYDDLIDKTLEMLNRVSPGWVHYKLDRGVDHVLIDEAQDTSPRQWDIIAHIISEFSAGKGARGELTRTIFAVGDEKQSIFSFQGAAPREFDQRRHDLRRKFEAAGLKFDPVSFNYSFRSGAAILQSVDHVFRDEAIYRSIHAEKTYPLHHALGDAGPSLVELWDLAEPDKKQDIEGWRAPFDGVSATSPEVKLARRIQAEIKQLVESGTLAGHKGERRPLRYGDVLVLVRRRGNVFDAVIQALKHANIPVAGADRLKLTDHIAIVDLMNLADALLLPQDDLALAVALKSPLFGLDDDDLFTLRWGHKVTLRRALAEQAVTNERFNRALRRLEACEVRAREETPFAFYAWLLGGDGGRARILRRLGLEANDALDEFLELALNHERRAPASLQGFMAWLRAADTEVKRDMEISRDEVRVMTVHGAKGLEASVVFLVDTTSSPSDSQRLRLIHMPSGNGQVGSSPVVVWAGGKTDDPKVVADARSTMLGETEDEYRRLLYVAMTRAADRLIVGGCMPGNRKSVRGLSWYDLIDKGLNGSGLEKQTIETPLGKVTRFALSEAAPIAEEPRTAKHLRTTRQLEFDFFEGGTAPAALGVPAASIAGRIELPSWLRTTAPKDTIENQRVRPADQGHSGLAVEEGRAVGTSESTRSRAIAGWRGTLVHRLLQSLPDLAIERRREAALNFLERNAANWRETDRERLAERVLALIADSRFAAVFASGSRAEVAIVGRLERAGGPPALVSGQVDRLVVTPAEVLIVDFKTSQTPPRDASDAPAGYVRQLALYRAVLAKLYPQTPIRAALLWTEGIELMEISAPALDAALASVQAGISELDPGVARS